MPYEIIKEDINKIISEGFARIDEEVAEIMKVKGGSRIEALFIQQDRAFVRHTNLSPKFAKMMFPEPDDITEPEQPDAADDNV